MQAMRCPQEIVILELERELADPGELREEAFTLEKPRIKQPIGRK